MLPKRPSESPITLPLEVEQTVLSIRQHLKEESPLGEFGCGGDPSRDARAQACAFAFLATPSTAFLSANGALDYRRRIRRSPPPKGLVLADVGTTAGRTRRV